MERWERISSVLVVLSCLAACSKSHDPSPPKRVVLVTIDTWRADALGVAGAGRVETPNLDALAREGMYCPRAFSSATLTAPSHATILTGREPYEHGVRENRGFRLPDSVGTLAEALRGAGYATAAFVSAHPLARVSGLDRGFDTYDDRLPPGNPLSVAPRWRKGQETLDATGAWLANAPERFFLWVHLYEPHDPYDPPEPYRGTYRASPYYGEVAYVDALVGRLRTMLGSERDRDSLWVICGDHGESLGEHGERTHGIFVYDATARVPLVIRAPGRLAPSRREFARLLDIAPTVLELCHVGAPSGITGSSLLAAPPRGQGPAYVETLYAHLDFAAAAVRALSDGHYKVIDVPEREIYDLARDPREEYNLASKESIPEAERLVEALARLPATGEAALADDAREEDAKALRSLGYIGAGGEYRLAQKGMDPKAFAALYGKLDRVHALCEARHFEEAIPLYQELLGSFPGSGALFSELGLAEMATGRTAEAERHLRRSLEIAPANAHALLGLANLALERADFASAERHLLEVVKLDPDDVEANFDLGTLYYQSLGRPERAVPYWERFLKLQPQDPEAPRIRSLLAGKEAASAR